MVTNTLPRVIVAGLLCSLAACSGTGSDSPGSSASSSAQALPSTSTEAPPSAGPTSPSSPGQTEPSAPSANPTIPAPLQGSWLLVDGSVAPTTAAPCPSAGEAAGKLIDISPNAIGFFETRAILDSVLESSASTIHARYREQVGDTVSVRELVLEAQDGGRILVTRDLDAGADAGPMRYERCLD